MVELLFKRGSGAPTLAIVCPTARMAPSTVRALTGFPEGAMAPERYLTAKIWSIWMGSVKASSRGLMASSTQNERHRSQWRALALSEPAHTPVLTVCRAQSISVSAAAATAGSRAAKVRAVGNGY